MSLLLIRAPEVRDLLPMAECIEVMDSAMRACSNGTITLPKRTVVPLGNGTDFFFLMPGSMEDPAVYGAKVVGLHPGNPDQGRPAVQGIVILFDLPTGAPLVLMDGAEITRIRTAAASALATRELARQEAGTHGILGTGLQAAAHLEAISCIRDIEEVKIWGRDYAKARRLAVRFSGLDGPEICAVRDPAEAAACDIVSVATNSSVPVLKGEWIAPGTHLNLVGAHEPEHREADSDAVASSTIYVDSRQGAMREAGDLLIPIAEGRIREMDIAGEIGEVLNGSVVGRLDDRQITLYKSLGIVAQDLFAAEHIFRNARARGLGLPVDLSG